MDAIREFISDISKVVTYLVIGALGIGIVFLIILIIQGIKHLIGLLILKIKR